MLDLTVIILTYNESLHIRRCLANVKLLAKRVVVIDSQSTDDTVDICMEMGVEVVSHPWPGNQAEQFNWALDYLQIETEWILRLDADEYLLPELVKELEQRVPSLSADVTGIELRRRHIFMGRWVKHGIYPVLMLRMFRNGFGRYEQRLMDEHVTLKRGTIVQSEHDFVDHSLIHLSDYCRKHVGYSVREAAMALDEEYGLADPREELNMGQQAKAKHKIKSRYYRMPLFLRSFSYFLYRYIFRGGFLDGKEGFLFAFLQGWWYRTLVDAKIYEIKKACGEDKEKIRQHLKEVYGISL